MKMNNSLVGKRIAQLRKRRGLSQLMLSEMIDRSPTHLSYIETGAKSMSLETFVRIANALNASADELLNEIYSTTPMWHQHMRFPRCCLTVQNMKSRCFWILFWPLKVP